MGKYCCSCSGDAGRCKSCSCVRAKRECFDCRPGVSSRYNNRRVSSLQPSRPVAINANGSLCRMSLVVSQPVIHSHYTRASSSRIENLDSAIPPSRLQQELGNRSRRDEGSLAGRSIAAIVHDCRQSSTSSAVNISQRQTSSSSLSSPSNFDSPADKSHHQIESGKDRRSASETDDGDSSSCSLLEGDAESDGSFSPTDLSADATLLADLASSPSDRHARTRGPQETTAPRHLSGRQLLE